MTKAIRNDQPDNFTPDTAVITHAAVERRGSPTGEEFNRFEALTRELVNTSKQGQQTSAP